MIQKTSSAALLLLLWLASPTQATFEAGTVRIGAGLGLRGSESGTLFSLEAVGGLFVLRGFELSVGGLFQTGGDAPLLGVVTGGLRFIPFTELGTPRTRIRWAPITWSWGS